MCPSPDGDWIHSTVDTARAPGIHNPATWEPDMPLPDLPPQPPWATCTFHVALSTHSSLQSLLPSLLLQESRTLIGSLHTPASSLYFTHGSAGADGTVGAACVRHATTISVRLPDGSSAFQAEFTAIFLALNHAASSPPSHFHVITDSIFRHPGHQL